MNIRKRAMLSLKYNWKRNSLITILQAVSFLAVFILYFSYISTKNQVEYIGNTLGNTITIHKNSTENPVTPTLFTKEDIEKIRGSDKIDFCDVLSSHQMTLKDAQPYIENKEEYQRVSEKSEYGNEILGLENTQMGNCKLFAVTDSSQLPFFTGSGFRLEKGKKIGANDDGKQIAMISEELAKENNLSLGDDIEVYMPELFTEWGGKSKEVLSLKIDGIFSWKDVGQNSVSIYDHPANYIFVPEGGLEQYQVYPTIVYAISKDSFQLDETVKAIEKRVGNIVPDTNGMDSTFKYKWDPEWSTEVGRPLKQVQRLTKSIFMVVMFAMLCITGITFVFYIKARAREFKIFKDMGEKKIKVIFQTYIECIIVLLPAILTAVLLAYRLAPKVNTYIAEPYMELVEQKLTTQKEEQLLDMRLKGVTIEESLYNNSFFLRGVNKQMDIKVEVLDIIFISSILTIVVSGVILFIIVWEIIRLYGEKQSGGIL